MGRKLFSVYLLSVTFRFAVSASFPQFYTPICLQEPDKCIDSSKIYCEHGKYRTLDGSCNNPVNPTLGMAYTTYRRLLPPNYADGIYSIPVAASGNALPSARLLSYKVFGRTSSPDPENTLLNMQWGQIVTHDTSIRVPDGYPGLRPLPKKRQLCCNTFGQYEVQNVSVPCLPIAVSKEDPFFHHSECIPFDRTITDKDQECPGMDDDSPANQISGVTHYLDLSFVYGNSKEDNKALRSFSGGLLKTSERGTKWPPKSDDPESVCSLGDPNDNCYKFGDLRGNQNTGLTILQIVLLREHNRLAHGLSELNRHWDDETLFQEARRINIAQFQHITYYEWNVNFYGARRLLREGLIYKTYPGGYVNDYNPCNDPRSIQAFQQSAFRYFHNQIMGILHLVSETREAFNTSIHLTNLVDKPGLLEQGCFYSSFVRGLSTQPAKLTDHNFDFQAAEKFPIAGGVRSYELRSFDLQRGRDHGLASYNDYREFCGMARASHWKGYADLIPHEDIRKLQSLYESHEDVDLSVGGALERHLSGALVGPTFMCINLIQFWSLRTGDRYFFENEDQPYPFDPDQLMEIRKASVARLLCDNGDVQNMQRFAFRKVSKRNPLQPCEELPAIDLTKWKDYQWR